MDLPNNQQPQTNEEVNLEPVKPLEEGEAKDAFQEQQDKEAAQLEPAFEMNLEEGETLLQRLEKIRGDMMSDFAGREMWRRLYEYDLWNNEYRLFFSNQYSTKTKTRSKIFVPIINNIVQIATSKLIGFINGSDDMFDVKAKSPTEENIAGNIKLLVEDQLEQTGFADKFEDFIVQLLIYGTSYFFVDWEEKWSWVYERVTDPVTGIEKPTKKYKCVANRPRISVLDIADVYPTQNYANIDDMPGIFIRRWISVDEFKNKVKSDDYFGNKAAALKLDPTEKFQESRQLRKANRGEMATVAYNQIELLEYWGPYDLDGDGIKEECQIVVANRTTVLRAVPNPFHHQKRPVIKCNLCSVPMEFYGISLIEPVIAQQEELNTIRRQKLDMTTVCINRMWLRRNGCSVEDSQLVSRPNGVIDVDDVSADLKLVEPITIPTDAFTDSAQIVNDMMSTTVPQSLTGSVNDLKSANQPGTVRANITQALEKFGTYASNIEKQAIVPVLELMYQLDLQYLNNSEIIRAFYGNLFTNPAVVSPAMIRGQVIFEMKALTDMIGKDVKVSQIMALLASSTQILSPQSQDYLLKQLAELLGLDQNAISAANATPQPMLPGGQAPIPGVPLLPGVEAPIGDAGVPPPLPAGLPAALKTPGGIPSANPTAMGVKGVPNLPLGLNG